MPGGTYRLWKSHSTMMILDGNNIVFLSAKSKYRMDFGRTFFYFVFLVVFIVFQCRTSEASCKTDSECWNGNCVESNCECFAGWTGASCDQCGGRIGLTDSSGFIYESIGNYDVRTKCTWLIDSGRNDSIIHLFVEEFATECSWDYLHIFDGDSIYAPTVAAFSGPIQYQDADIRHNLALHSGYAYLYFYSDAAFFLEGFNISYSIGECPSKNCSGNGVCDLKTQTCSCDPGWTGNGCHIPTCPSNCSGNGLCTDGKCDCEPNYRGRDCQARSDEGLWEVKEEKISVSVTAAASVLVGDQLWIVGGFHFERREVMPVLWYNFDTGTSEEIDLLSVDGDLPSPRYAHSAVLHKDKIIIYGGTLLNSDGVTSEIWILDTTTRMVMRVADVYNTSSDDAITLNGHTAHVIGDTMWVFFGYSAIYGYINWVQKYNITSKEWTTTYPEGVEIRGSYGHSSVYDPATNKVYIHGGYILLKLSEHRLQDTLVEFDVSTEQWRLLPSSSQARFFHSAVLFNSKMYIYGGNSHTDVSSFSGSQCFSSSFLVYDINCKKWYSEDITSGLTEMIPRYGQGAIWYGDSMWLFGGFNGLVVDDVLIYTPVNCSAISNSTQCVLSGKGPSCAWDFNLGKCVDLTRGLSPQHNASVQACPTVELPHECSKLTTCSLCIEKFGCGWCNNTCSDSCAEEPQNFVCDVQTCSISTNCYDCNLRNNCRWIQVTNTRRECISSDTPGSINDCRNPCADRRACLGCISVTDCMWCPSEKRCIPSSTYMTSFPFGQCLAWRTYPASENCNNLRCRDYKQCSDCHIDPACGWCDNGDKTGLGTCMEGSNSGPVNTSDPNYSVNMDFCPTRRWFFSDCPSCQCNGHSICSDGETCDACQDYTEGDNCETCQLGFHGVPLNGNNCSSCECNGHADICEQNQMDSVCYCVTKGIVGDTCDRCDSSSSYYGDPKNGGTCFYGLQMNYKYTFDFSDADEKNLTSVNLMMSPEDERRDIEFLLTVLEPVDLTITVKSYYIDGEEIIINKTHVSLTFRYRFSRYDYDFRPAANTTFYIYISNFTTPFWFQVQVTQQIRIEDLLQFLLVFFSVFLSFMLFFALAWKVKQHIHDIRRRQQREVELAEMASRPFSTINLEIKKTAPPDLLANVKSKTFPAIAIASEPLKDHKAALTTVVMQMPMPDGECVPEGQARIALATALVYQKQKKHHEHRERAPSLRMTNATTAVVAEDCQENSENGGYDNPAMV